MATETLYATSLTSGAIGTSANALGAPNGTFTTDADNTSWNARFAMGNPTGNQANGTHTVTLRVRKETGTGTPTLNTVTLYQGTTQISAIGAGNWSVTSTTGEDIVITFASSLLSGVDLSTIEIEAVATSSGGGPSARSTVQLDGITWSGDFTAVTNANITAVLIAGAVAVPAVTVTAEQVVDANIAPSTITGAVSIPGVTYPRTNLVPNPSLEVDTTGWVAGGSVTIARVTTDSYAGSACLQQTSEWANSTAYCRLPAETITASLQKFQVSAWVKQSVASTITMRVVANNATYSAPSNQLAVTTTTVGEWAQIVTEYTGPATLTINNTAMQLEFWTSTDAHVLLIDAVKVERAELLPNTTYFDGDTPDDAQFAYSWSGTPHASASIMAERVVSDWSASVNATTTAGGADANVSPSTIAGTVSLAGLTSAAGTGASISPTTVAVSVSLAGTTAQAGSDISFTPTTVAGSVSLAGTTAQAGGSATVSPTTVSGSVRIGTVDALPQQVPFTVRADAAVVSGAGAGSLTVSASTAIGAPTVFAGTSATISPVTVTGSTTVAFAAGQRGAPSGSPTIGPTTYSTNQTISNVIFDGTHADDLVRVYGAHVIFDHVTFRGTGTGAAGHTVEVKQGGSVEIRNSRWEGAPVEDSIQFGGITGDQHAGHSIIWNCTFADTPGEDHVDFKESEPGAIVDIIDCDFVTPTPTGRTVQNAGSVGTQNFLRCTGLVNVLLEGNTAGGSIVDCQINWLYLYDAQDWLIEGNTISSRVTHGRSDLTRLPTGIYYKDNAFTGQFFFYGGTGWGTGNTPSQEAYLTAGSPSWYPRAAGTVYPEPSLVGTGATVSPSTVSRTVSIAGHSAQAGGAATVLADTISVSSTIAGHSAQAGQSATVSASTVSRAVSVAGYTTRAFATVSPSTVSRTVSVAGPTPQAGQSATVSPSTVSRTVSIAGHTAQAGGSATVSASTVSGAASIGGPVVLAAVSAEELAATVNSTVTISAPTVFAGSGGAAAGATVARQVVIPTPVVLGTSGAGANANTVTSLVIIPQPVVVGGSAPAGEVDFVGWGMPI